MSDVSDHFSMLTKIPDADKPNKRNKMFYRRSKLTSEKWEQFNNKLKTVLRQNLDRKKIINPNSAV